MAKTGRKIRQSPLKVAETLVSDRDRRGLQSATPERLVQVGDAATIGADNVQRITVDPLERLRNRGLLAPDKDPETNEALFRAGEQYRRIWWESGLGRSCASMNISGVWLPSEERNPGMPSSEKQAHFRGKLRAARIALGYYFSRVVDPIVLDGDEPEEVGKLVTGRRDARQSSAVALDRLSEGLRVLAVHFGELRS